MIPALALNPSVLWIMHAPVREFVAHVVGDTHHEAGSPNRDCNVEEPKLVEDGARNKVGQHAA